MARKIVITSGKGGVGKTTICAILGQVLAQKGYKVVLLDVDIGLNNLDVIAGIDEKVVYDVVDILEGKCRPIQALIRDSNNPNLFILPSAHPYNVGKVDSSALKEIVEYFSQGFDFILIDCPAGIDLGFQRAVFCASEAIIVTTPHIPAIRDANKVASILNGCNIPHQTHTPHYCFAIQSIIVIANQLSRDNTTIHKFDSIHLKVIPLFLRGYSRDVCGHVPRILGGPIVGVD